MAEVEKIKGVQFNYVNFLWKALSKIWELQFEGNYAKALKTATDLIIYLPNAIKKKFRDRIAKINENMRLISQNTDGPSLFVKSVSRNRILQRYARTALNSFMDDLCTELDQRGYMEKVAPQIPHGREIGY